MPDELTIPILTSEEIGELNDILSEVHGGLTNRNSIQKLVGVVASDRRIFDGLRLLARRMRNHRTLIEVG